MLFGQVALGISTPVAYGLQFAIRTWRPVAAPCDIINLFLQSPVGRHPGFDDLHAIKELEAALAELNSVQTLKDLEIENFPAIGAAYSAEVQLTCVP